MVARSTAAVDSWSGLLDSVPSAAIKDGRLASFERWLADFGPPLGVGTGARKIFVEAFDDAVPAGDLLVDLERPSRQLELEASKISRDEVALERDRPRNF